MIQSNHLKLLLEDDPMARRKRVGTSQQPKKKQINWTTTIWYIIGALIVIAMVFSLVAGAFR